MSAAHLLATLTRKVEGFQLSLQGHEIILQGERNQLTVVGYKFKTDGITYTNIGLNQGFDAQINQPADWIDDKELDLTRFEIEAVYVGDDLDINSSPIGPGVWTQLGVTDLVWRIRESAEGTYNGVLDYTVREIAETSTLTSGTYTMSMSLEE